MSEKAEKFTIDVLFISEPIYIIRGPQKITIREPWFIHWRTFQIRALKSHIFRINICYAQRKLCFKICTFIIHPESTSMNINLSKKMIPQVALWKSENSTRFLTLYLSTTAFGLFDIVDNYLEKSEGLHQGLTWFYMGCIFILERSLFHLIM